MPYPNETKKTYFCSQLNAASIILAIESSCDDTSAAVIINGSIKSNRVAGQKIHEEYGGVVPELASRDHEKNIVPVVKAALDDAEVQLNELSAIAFTAGPGLIGSLLVGVTFAKGLALSLGIPLIEVNHLQAHIMAHLIPEQDIPSFPYLCLLVSGGHTQIVKVDAPLQFELLGQTNDDAAGEAFDKSAKLLGLPYPGGPLIDKYSQNGDPKKFKFPIPQVAGFNYSFSGFKTSVLYFLQKEIRLNPNFVEQHLEDLCASIQSAIADIVFQKFELAIQTTQIKQLALAGGVAANSLIRSRFNDLSSKYDAAVYIPKFEYCTDNAAMIAITAHYQFKANKLSNQEVVPFARQQ